MTSAGLTMQIASTPIALFALVQAVTYLMAPTASLVSITEDDHDVHLYLAYATADNFMGRSVYRNAYCYLHPDAEKALSRASLSARQAGVRLLVFDAYRPAQAQQILFDYAQDPTFVADPKRGSHHTRGCAVEVSLLDENGQQMDMGTGFDAMQAESFHFCAGLPEQVQKNRLMLLGIMLSAGFEHIPSEWWHYQLPGAIRYPLIEDGAGGVHKLME